MKTIRLITFMLVAAVAIGTQSCKKDSNEGTSGTGNDDATQMQQAADESAYAQESESAMNDADNAMSYSGFGKGGFKIDGAVIDSFTVDKKLVITYSGNNGNGSRHRSGKISIQLTSGSHWRDQGAVVTITFTNYVVKNNSSGKKITLNGTYTVTNMTGGSIIFLGQGDSVSHRTMGTMSISFDGSTQRQWTVTRDRVIGKTNSGTYYISIKGFGVEGSENNVAVKGATRSGKSFMTVISSPVVFSSSCSWNAIRGSVVYKGMGTDVNVTYGVDASGDIENTGCPYGYRVNWINASGEAKIAVVKY
jgi:hypothetical protein